MILKVCSGSNTLNSEGFIMTSQLKKKPCAFLLVFVLLYLSCFSQSQIQISVCFGFNKASLDSVDILKMDSIISRNDIVSASIEANSDTVGSVGFNRSLSFKRANAIKKLLSRKLTSRMIEIKSNGEEFATDDNQDLNRCAKVIIYLKGVKSVSNNLSLPDDLSSLRSGSFLRIPNLNFYPGKHILLPGSFKTLEQLFGILNRDKNIEIELGGHICCLPENQDDGYDDDTKTDSLSFNRAKEVYNYLVQKGIEKSRLSYKGYGAKKKLVEENSENARSINRRVEIKILKN